MLICIPYDLHFVIIVFRDVISVPPPSNSLLDEIAFLQSEKKPEIKTELTTLESLPSKPERKLSCPAKIEEIPPPRPDRKQKSPVKEEEIPPPKPERKLQSVTSVEENSHTNSEKKVNLVNNVEEISHATVEVKLKSRFKEEEHLPTKPERTLKSPVTKEEVPPPKPERKPKSPVKQEEVIISEHEQSNHSKPDIPPKPCVPPKPTATSKYVPTVKPIPDSKKFTFVKPKTPPKPGDKSKPVPPPRPDKTPDKSAILKESAGEIQTAKMSDPDKTDVDRKGSGSNQSTNISNQDQNPKRFSSLSAGAAMTFSKDQCDGDLIKTRSPASGSTVRSRESRNSSHSDNFLKPLCASNSLSTSVGFLVEKKHSPVPKPKVEKPLKEKLKDMPPRRHLHRSHSDLSSCRHSRTSSDFSDLSSRISRTSTEVERFFSEMGIDRTVLDPLLNTHGKTNDYFDSFSSIDSQEARSVSSRISCGGDLEQVPAESEQDLMERSTTVTSVVERNARIIKWLCNVKKAKNSNTNVASQQNKVANVWNSHLLLYSCFLFLFKWWYLSNKVFCNSSNICGFCAFIRDQNYLSWL